MQKFRLIGLILLLCLAVSTERVEAAKINFNDHKAYVNGVLVYQQLSDYANKYTKIVDVKTCSVNKGGNQGIYILILEGAKSQPGELKSLSDRQIDFKLRFLLKNKVFLSGTTTDFNFDVKGIIDVSWLYPGRIKVSSRPWYYDEKKKDMVRREKIEFSYYDVEIFPFLDESDLKRNYNFLSYYDPEGYFYVEVREPPPKGVMVSEDPHILEFSSFYGYDEYYDNGRVHIKIEPKKYKIAYRRFLQWMEKVSDPDIIYFIRFEISPEEAKKYIFPGKK